MTEYYSSLEIVSKYVQEAIYIENKGHLQDKPFIFKIDKNDFSAMHAQTFQ